MEKLYARVSAISGYVPEKKLTNADLEKMVDTNDEWIKTRTGIKERRILEEGKATSDLAFPVVIDLCKQKGISPEDIECIIVATTTPDMFFPSTSNLVAYKSGAKNAWTFDLMAACSGFLFALNTGANLIASGRYTKVIVIGADKMSSIVDYTDRNTCVLFGDGAGGVLLEPTTKVTGIVDSILRVDGVGKDFLYMKAGGSQRPSSIETVTNKEHFIFQEGTTVFKYAVKAMADVSYEMMQKHNLQADDVKYLVPHQANLRIIKATADRMGLDMDKVMINIEKYGNTTAATIPLCLWEWKDKLKNGDNLILASFGAGFTWGSIFLKWDL